MEPPANERVKAVFQAALERTTQAERTAFLDQACADDTALRRRVEDLLRAHESPDPLLDHSAAELLDADAGAQGGVRGGDAEETDDWLGFLAPPSKPDSLGRLGHYEVLEVAGRGGMGIVFRAFDDKLRRVVAIKALAPALAASPKARRQFVREARAAAAVAHENVVAIHAVEDDGPVPYLVMQFVQGISLQQKIDRSGPLPLKAILRIGLHVAEGLAAAHRQGLVHRDVKPANILLENGVERVKITDFGLARAGDAAGVTQTGLFTGTPAYMSPEQARGEAVDARSDLFSLGGVLYAMGTGSPPFAASSTLAVLKRVCEESPRPAREANAELPDWLGHLLSRLHAKAPADRPASAREVADLLARRLAELQDGGPPPSATPPPQPRAALRRRRPWLASAAVLLCVSIAALALSEATGVSHIRTALRRRVSGADAAMNGPNPAPGSASADHAGPKQGPAAAGAAEAEWEWTVAGLPPERQAQAVADRLKKLNPGFDGTFTQQTTGTVVTDFRFSAEHVSDIAPVHALTGLTVLVCSAPESAPGPLADLSPLKGMSLLAVQFANTAVSDLSPLHGMPLDHLICSHTRVSDLSPLRGMRLHFLIAEVLDVSDVSPLRGMPLTYLGLYRTRVSDLSPLKGMPLEYLNLAEAPLSDPSLLKDIPTLRHLCLDGTPITDLSVLKGLPLESLGIRGTPVTDLSPLEGMPLRGIELSYQPRRDARVLRSLKSLEEINRQKVADFWKDQPE